MRVYVRCMHSKERELYTGIREIKTASPKTPILKVTEMKDGGIEIVIKQNCYAIIQKEGILRVLMR